MSVTHRVDEDYGGHRNILGSDGIWIFEQSVLGYNPKGVVLEEATIDNKIILNGKFEAPDDGGVGILASGLRTEIEIGKSGLIDAYVGVRLTGAEQTLVNNGLIACGNNAVQASGANVTVINNGMLQSDIGTQLYSYHGLYVNNGSIFGYDALSIGGEDSKLVLNKSSMVSGERNGVESSGELGETITIINKGVVSGDSRAMSLYNADFTLVNRGEINGDIVTYYGDSIFDFRSGTLEGVIRGGDGDDTYMFNSTKIALIEDKDDGYDTIKSAVSYDLSTGVNAGQEIEVLKLLGTKNLDATGNEGYNHLAGNAGNNALSGNGGIDTLDGGKGNDLLTGGLGTDYFTFKTGGGHDVITDFVKFSDQIDLTSWKGIDSFDDMMRHHVTFEDGNVVISNGQDSLTLEGVAKSDLQSGDFFY